MKGMTLLEILLVIGITTIIATIGGVGLSQMQAQFQLKSAGDEIRSQLQRGREMAIANKDGASYRIKSQGNAVILTANNTEISRYLIPSGIAFSPSTFNWGFDPVTGRLNGCALPCTFGMTFRSSSETIIIRSNGIVD